MTPREELIQAIEQSPDELIRALLELLRVWQQSLVLQQNAAMPPLSQVTPEQPKTAWTVLRTHAGSIEMPEDWSKEHDHYLYGIPKQALEP